MAFLATVSQISGDSTKKTGFVTQKCVFSANSGTLRVNKVLIFATHLADRCFMNWRDGKIRCSDFPYLNNTSIVISIPRMAVLF